MNNDERAYHSYSGTKLSYSETETGTYKQIYGITTSPDIGKHTADL